MDFKVETNFYYEEEYVMIKINSGRTKWEILVNSNTHNDIEMYKEMLSSVKSDKKYELYEGRDSNISFTYNEGVLEIKSYTVVCSHDMTVIMTFNKEESIVLLSNIIDTLSALEYVHYL